MALKLTRGTDSLLYLGKSLDSSDLEGSSDFRLWVRRINNFNNKQSAVLNVMSREGVVEAVLDADEPTLQLDGSIAITLTDIVNHHLERTPFCRHCGRGDRMNHRAVPQLRLSVAAPRNVSILRGDAKVKKGTPDLQKDWS